MKYIIVFLMFCLYNPLNGQPHSGKQPREFSRRFEELEKIKLLEILDMDEEIAIKFFARRNKMKNRIKTIIEDEEKLFDKMEESLNGETDSDIYGKLVRESLETEHMVFEERSKFIYSLTDILSNEQIIKLILFEKKFKKDVRDLLIERGRKKFFKKN